MPAGQPGLIPVSETAAQRSRSSAISVHRHTIPACPSVTTSRQRHCRPCSPMATGSRGRGGVCLYLRRRHAHREGGGTMTRKELEAIAKQEEES